MCLYIKSVFIKTTINKIIPIKYQPACFKARLFTLASNLFELEIVKILNIINKIIEITKK